MTLYAAAAWYVSGGTFTVRIVGERPPTANGDKRGNYRERARVCKAWRAAAAEAATKVGGKVDPTPVIVVATPLHKNGRTAQDTGNCYPAVKAVVDGLVDAGIIPNDTGRYVYSVTLIRPDVCGDDGLLVSVSPV